MGGYKVDKEVQSIIDRIWETFWTGGVANPVTIIEQITYLLFLKELDDKETNKESILEIMLKTMHGEHIYPQDTFVVKFGNITNHDLTKRELQILKEMLAGDSNAEIAKRLYISSGTVKRHIENMLLKTGFHTRTELAAEAGRLGIVIKNSGV